MCIRDRRCYIGHWRVVVQAKQAKKVKRKRAPTQHWSNALCTPPVCCTFHSTTAALQRRFLSKNPGYDAVAPFLRCIDLLFTLVSLWCFAGGEEEWGLGMRSCLVWSGIQAPSQLSILVSAWAPSHICLVSASGHLLICLVPAQEPSHPGLTQLHLQIHHLAFSQRESLQHNFVVWNHISVWYMYLTKLFLFDISNQAFTSASTLTSCSPFHHSQAGPWMIATIVSEYCISKHVLSRWMCCLVSNPHLCNRHVTEETHLSEQWMYSFWMRTPRDNCGRPFALLQLSFPSSLSVFLPCDLEFTLQSLLPQISVDTGIIFYAVFKTLNIKT